MLALVLGHQLQIAAPLVFHPHGVVILVVRAESQHDFGGVQRGKDVRLILRAQLVLQRNAAEKHPVTFLRQRVVHVLRDDAVHGALSILGSLLVADENIVGWLFVGHLHDASAQLLDGLGLVPVDTPRHGVGVLQCLLKVAVFHHAVKAGAVAGGNFLSCGGVVHILDAVAAQHKTPVGLGLRGEVRHDALIHTGGLVELTGEAQPVGTGEQCQLFLIVSGGYRLLRTTVFAHGDAAALDQLQISTAHFAFDNRHFSFSPRLFQRMVSSVLSF